MTPELLVFFTSMIPWTDIKLSIPLGLEMGMSSFTTFLFAVTGTLLPAAIIMGLIGPAANLSRKHSEFLDSFLTKLFHTTKKKHSEKFQRYGPFFIILLVAIPFPGSGPVTGSIVSYLFGLEYWKAFTLIVIGSSIAGLFLTMGFTSIFAIIEAMR